MINIASCSLLHQKCLMKYVVRLNSNSKVSLYLAMGDKSDYWFLANHA